MRKRFLSTVLALLFMFACAATAFAATTDIFYAGYRNQYTKGSIAVELTNISFKKNVLLSETQAAEYFDDADILNWVMDVDYDSDEEITIRDILAYYNNKGGVPTYYADTAPVVVTAKTALRTFFFSYYGDVVKHTYEPKYYTYDEYIYNFDNKTAYAEQPEEDWLFADGTKVSLDKPGKYIFIVRDDGLVSSSYAGMFCVHIGDTSYKTPVTAQPTSSKVLVNGKAIEFDAYKINDNNYFKLRDFAQAVNNTEKNFEVIWDEENNAIRLILNKPYTPVGGELSKGDGKAKTATPTTSKIYKDGEEILLTAYNINYNNYFKLRDMARAFDIGVTWDEANNTIIIDTSISYVDD